jgi:hypothetical protein
LGGSRCICGFVGSGFPFLEPPFGLGRINVVTVSPVALPSETAQALRSKKTISATRRMVPSNPPPMYINIPGLLSVAASKHIECCRVGALPYIATRKRAAPDRWLAIFRAYRAWGSAARLKGREAAHIRGDVNRYSVNTILSTRSPRLRCVHATDDSKTFCPSLLALKTRLGTFAEPFWTKPGGCMTSGIKICQQRPPPEASRRPDGTADALSSANLQGHSRN